MTLPLPHWFIPRLGRPRGPLSHSHIPPKTQGEMKPPQTLSASWHARMQKTFSPGGLSLTGADSVAAFNPPLTFTHTNSHTRTHTNFQNCISKKKKWLSWCLRMQPVLSGRTTARRYYWPDLAFSNRFLQPGAWRDRFIAPRQFPCLVLSLRWHAEHTQTTASVKGGFREGRGGGG